jgi:hypothetical protein
MLIEYNPTHHRAGAARPRAEGGQKLAGHASISNTARYAHCEMDELREAVEIVEITHTGPTPVPALVAID